MEAYASFVTFMVHELQEFLFPFQSTESMIHFLYPVLCGLMNALQSKFVSKIKLSSNDTTKNISMLEMAGTKNPLVLLFSIFILIFLITCLCCNMRNMFTLINVMLQSH